MGSDNGDDWSAILSRTDANLASQQWKFATTSDGYYQIISQQYSKVVDVSGISFADRAPIYLWDYTGGNNQQWKPQVNADGYV